MNHIKIITSGVCLLLLAVILLITTKIGNNDGVLGGVVNYLDTSSSGFTSASTTINTTSTQVFASISKRAWIINNTTSTLTCFLDSTNKNAASSSVSSGIGVIIGGTAATSLPGIASFGECSPGMLNCYPHKGAVNCLGSGQSIISKVSQ